MEAESSHAGETNTAQSFDVAIIGAGAAGLMAAIFAGRTAKESAADRPTPRVVALDGALRVGAKILVAGGGRCNVTHDAVYPDDFFGSNSKLVARVLRSFTVEQTLAFFSELGVTLKLEETGKYFPTTDDAHTVLDALLTALADSGAQLLTSARVSSLTLLDDGLPTRRFRLETTRGPIEAKSIVLATGGLALPRSGSAGAGYAFATALGHSLVPTTPALVPLLLEQGCFLTALSGVAFIAELVLSAGSGKVIRREVGSTLLTHFGLSGPAILDISRHYIAARKTDSGARLVMSALPGFDFAKTEGWLVDNIPAFGKSSVLSFVREALNEARGDERPPERFIMAMVQHGAQVDPATPMARLTRDERRRLVRALVELPLPVVGDRGYTFAEVTAGGVPLNEVETSTMGSKRCAGLFLCGEVLDVDGRIGGYNFQWAWASGRLAGTFSMRASQVMA